MEHKKYIDFLNEVSIRDYSSNWIAILTLDQELITKICTTSAKYCSNIHLEKIINDTGCGCDYWGDRQYSRDNILEVKFEIP